jgi:hypothetical protein
MYSPKWAIESKKEAWYFSTDDRCTAGFETFI